MTTLEGWIAAAQRRLTEAHEAAERERHERALEELHEQHERFQRELDRALGPELLSALGGRVWVDIGEHAVGYEFSFRGYTLNLEYVQDEDLQVWYVNCAQGSSQSAVEQPEPIPGSLTPPLSFRDRLVLAIEAAAPPPNSIDQAA